MPAHTREDEVGVTLKGDGCTLTAIDRAGNARADVEAKLAAAAQRVPKRIREAVGRITEDATALACWVGMSGLLANHRAIPPHRDSEAKRSFAPAGVKRELAKRQMSTEVKASRMRPPQLGGHNLLLRGSVWQCCECRMSSTTLEAIGSMRCMASSATRWAARATLDAKRGLTDGGGHQRFLPGHVLWCRRCGCYADLKAGGLQRVCLGPPPSNTCGSQAMQLERLLRGLHPCKGGILDTAIAEPGLTMRGARSACDFPPESRIMHGFGRQTHADLCVRPRKRAASEVALPQLAGPAPPGLDRIAAVRRRVLLRLAQRESGANAAVRRRVRGKQRPHDGRLA